MLRLGKVRLSARFAFAILAVGLFVATSSARPFLRDRISGLHRTVPKHTLLDSGADRSPSLDNGGPIAAPQKYLTIPAIDGLLHFHGRVLDRAVTDSFVRSPRRMLTKLRRILPLGEDPS